jgi:hypothetical protein
VRAYLAFLKQEITFLKSILPDGATLSWLHWGGSELCPKVGDGLIRRRFEVA